MFLVRFIYTDISRRKGAMMMMMMLIQEHNAPHETRGYVQIYSNTYMRYKSINIAEKSHMCALSTALLFCCCWELNKLSIIQHESRAFSKWNLLYELAYGEFLKENIHIKFRWLSAAAATANTFNSVPNGTRSVFV